MRADAAGLQICTHAIGDQGISIILDLYSEVVKAHGERDRRFRIEHAQHMAAKDFDRFAQLHVIASMQPYHAIDDGRWAEGRIGHDRASRTYAFRTFLDHGVRLPSAPTGTWLLSIPMLGLYAAVTRATLDGKNPNGWFPEQKLTVAEAVEAYTMGSAYAEFQEKDKGSITPGKLADMVVLSDDIFSHRSGKNPRRQSYDHFGGRENRVGCEGATWPLILLSRSPRQFAHLLWVDSTERQRILHSPGCTNGHLDTFPVAA